MHGCWFARRVVTALLVLAVVIGQGTAMASAGSHWTAKEPRNPGSASNALNGVAMVSSDLAWAVGSYSDGTGDHTLIERWNGTGWRVVPSPDPGGSGNDDQLAAVAADSGTDAWAVGDWNNGVYSRALIEHWDGSSWKRVPSPRPSAGFFDDSLTGVAVISATDAWAVGSYLSDSTFDDPVTLIEHWDGANWTVVPSANPPATERLLEGVAADSATDAWAVGRYDPGDWQTLTEHWDGTSWEAVPSPNPPDASYSELKGVAAASPTSAWAVGTDNGNSNGTLQTLIEYWNGTSWTVVPSPSPGTTGDGAQLNAVTAVSADSAWAAGYAYNSTLGLDQTLIEHWDGTSWTVVPSPSPGTGDAQLNTVTASSTSAWAAGYYTSGTGSKTLALRRCSSSSCP